MLLKHLFTLLERIESSFTGIASLFEEADSLCFLQGNGGRGESKQEKRIFCKTKVVAASVVGRNGEKDTATHVQGSLPVPAPLKQHAAYSTSISI